jgi:hypothetical protein
MGDKYKLEGGDSGGSVYDARCIPDAFYNISVYA